MNGERLPPVWLLGLTNLPFGALSAVALITVPQLLAARGVPEPSIATVTTIALVPTFCAFLRSPILDIRLSRRTYAIGCGLLGALATQAALTRLDSLPVLATDLFLAVFALQLYVAAVAGWIGSLVDRESDAGFGAWFAAGNIGGFGLGAITSIWLLRALPFITGALAFCAACLLPVIMLAALPAPAPDSWLAR